MAPPLAQNFGKVNIIQLNIHVNYITYNLLTYGYEVCKSLHARCQNGGRTIAKCLWHYDGVRIIVKQISNKSSGGYFACQL